MFFFSYFFSCYSWRRNVVHHIVDDPYLRHLLIFVMAPSLRHVLDFPRIYICPCGQCEKFSESNDENLIGDIQENNGETRNIKPFVNNYSFFTGRENLTCLYIFNLPADILSFSISIHTWIVICPTQYQWSILQALVGLVACKNAYSHMMWKTEIANERAAVFHARGLKLLGTPGNVPSREK